MLLLEILDWLLGVTDAVVRHVDPNGEDTYEGSETEPFQTIGRALRDAPAGRRLVVRLKDGAEFTESLSLPSRVTIAGAATIHAADPGPAIRIEGDETTRVSGVRLEGVTLAGNAPYAGMGGAALVSMADDVRLDRCHLRDSQAGRGGGIAVIDSSAVTLDGCQFTGNRAGTEPASASVTPGLSGREFAFGTADGHGGGAFVRDSAIVVRDCTFSDNLAVHAGGGIAVAAVQQPELAVEIAESRFERNRTSHGPLGALGSDWSTGAPAFEPAAFDPVREEFNLTLVPGEGTESNVLGLAHGLGYETGLGGGIALRNTQRNAVVRDCTLTRNVARRGGGIHLYIGAYPRIERTTFTINASSGDGGGLAADYFDPLMPGNTPDFGIAPIPMVERRPVPIEDCTFAKNQAVEDGGGIYATGAALPRVTGGTFTENRSGEHGGGIRTTYASHLQVTGSRFEHNRSNVIVANKVDGDGDGGGAVSARNADVDLTGCHFQSNRALWFAGGAVYYRSAFEGGEIGLMGLKADIEGMFDTIQETAFDYRTRRLRIVDCTAATTAHWTPVGRAASSTSSAGRPRRTRTTRTRAAGSRCTCRSRAPARGSAPTAPRPTATRVSGRSSAATSSSSCPARWPAPIPPTASRSAAR